MVADPVDVIVVDNNSSDGTAEVCCGFQGNLALTYLFEPKAGKSNALNQAIRAARGELLLLTDDDVSITPDWITCMGHAARSYPEHSYFGGKILSEWQRTPPRWFRENHQWLGLTPGVDYGSESLESNAENRLFFLGANLAIRKQVFDEGMRFDPEFGPQALFGQKGSRHGADDWLIQHEMVGKGLKGVYVPDAIVYHRDPAVRMTKRYFGSGSFQWPGFAD